MDGSIVWAIGSWADEFGENRLACTLELRVGDLGGDLSSRGFQTIEHEPCPPGTLTLSVTFELKSRERGEGQRWRVEAFGPGLPHEYVEKLLASTLDGSGRFAVGMTPELAGFLTGLGERWHLNTLRAECLHQRSDPAFVSGEGDAGSRLGRVEPCGETGYQYGSAWLVEILPDWLLLELRDRVGLYPPSCE